MTIYTITNGEGSSTSSDTTTLNGAIRAIDTHPTVAATINLTGSIALTAGDLLALNVDKTTSITINGGSNISINGNGDQRGLFVYSGTVNVNNLTLTNMQALGGAGGGGAGGGAGLGGGLFVASAGIVTLDNVTFSSDKATGGAGGAGGAGFDTSGHRFKYTGGPPGGGGGGLGGNGGSATAQANTTGGLSYSGSAGGGGVGIGANGGSGDFGAGVAGIIPGASGSTGGGGSGGGGGANTSGGGGGVGGKLGSTSAGGGVGGFGGGGGAAGFVTGAAGGAGGFGGGGGMSYNGPGGKGGFGGGGGSSIPGGSGNGGFGAGNGGAASGNNSHYSWGGGGGGLGAGGDVFVQQGGSLTIEAGSLGVGTVKGGTGGAKTPATAGGNSGAGASGTFYGDGMFIEGTQSVTLAPAASTTLTISGAIADEGGNGGTGTGSLILNGAGTLQLAAANSFSGTTTLDQGTLELQNAGAAGSIGKIVFSTDSTATLYIPSVSDRPSNTINGWTIGQGTIDIGGIGTATSATIVSHILTVDYGSSSSLTLNLDSGEDYTGDKVKINPDSNISGSDFTIEIPVSPPIVTASNINVTGGTGTGGAFKIGDTVTATWNDSASGDNNSGITGVTVDFAQFGGGSTVAAIDASNVWTATYTIVPDSIDAAGRNVSVTASNTGGPTTTSGTNNVTVDDERPTVTTPNINLSGGTGPGGAFKIGDTVTATWNNSGTGDNNTDTINAGGVTVNFSQFGGGASVVATNASNVWTATYTIVSGTIDTTTAHAAVTATDHVGNTTTTSSSAVTADDEQPIVTTPNITLSGGTGPGGAFKIGDTVTAAWNNSGTGDNNTDTINAGGVTVDFSQFGGGASVVATNAANVWVATYTIVSGNIDTTTAHAAVTVTDHVGNTTTTSGSAVTADDEQPIVTAPNISLSGGTGTGGSFRIGDTVTATWNNSGTGDNNTDTINAGGVTVDFSQFGGGSSVVATDAGNVWTATYTIVSGAIDTTSADAAVTATDHVGNTTTTSGSAVTADDEQPIVTAPNISLSGGTGTGGSFRIGDTVTATWNNSGTGDNNTDTINAGGVTVDFSEFGGGSSVVATDAGNVWTATYTIVSGAIDTTSADAAVTATDHVGNTTTTSGSAVTADDEQPIVTAPNIILSGSTGTGGAFKIADTVTAMWNDSGTGDNNTDTINAGGVTVDFSQFGGGASVVATDNANIWTASYTIGAGTIDTTTAQAVVTVTDHVGNTTTADSGAVTADDALLTAGAVSVSGAVEGVTAGTLSAAFSDANTGAPTSDFSGTIAWGDGATTSFTSAAVSGSNGSYAVSGSHVYAEEGGYTATVTIDDEGGNTATETGTATVADAPLTAGAVSVSGAVEGVTAGTLSAAFSDANTGAPTSDFSGTITWGDGATTPFTSAAVSGSNGNYTVDGSHTYAEEGNYSTTVTINDVGGSTTTETGTATVADALLTAGAVSVSGAVEGTTAGTLSAAFSDANTGAPTSDFSGTIDWGDGSGDTNFTSAAVSGSNGNYTVDGSHTYAEEGNYSTTVTINDVGGSTTTETGTATVADAPLTAGAVSVSGAVEGVTAGTLSAAFSDANTGAPTSDFSGTITWGDGNTTSFTSAAVSGSNGSYAVSGSHLYAQDGSYTTTVTIDDVGGSTATETGTATVGDVPAIIAAGGTVDYEEGQSAAVALDGGLTVSDRNADLSSATVRIGTGFASGDTLHFSTQHGISGSYASGTGVLTLTGSATVANYQAALESITFSTTSTNAGDRTIDWVVGDGTVNSATATSTVDVTAGPSVVAGASVNYEAGQPAARALDGGLTVSDPSNVDLDSATVRVGTGFASGDALSFTNQNGIAGSYASGTGVLTLSGTATLAQYQTALRSIGFSTSSTTGGNRTIDWVVGDGTVTSATATSTVDVTAGPSVAAGASVGYEEGNATATALDASLTVADPSNADLSGATVRVGTGFASGDTLHFSTQHGISGGYASGTGVLTLTGSATVANYQAALESITFSTTSTNAGDRTIDWVVGDGTVNSATATSTVDVTAGPSVVAGASVNYEAGQPAARALDGGLTVSDPSNVDLDSATVRVGTGFASGDALSFTNQNGIAGSYASGTGVLTLSGSATLAQYQTALRSIGFSTSSTTGGDRTIDWVVGDGTVNSASVTSTVDVTAGPSVVAGASVGYEEGNATATALDASLTVADPSNADLSSATVRIGTGFASGDALSFTNQNGIAGSYASGTGVLTLSGTATLAQYQTALRSIGFSTSSTTGGNRTIDWAVGDGAVNSTSVTSTVDVTAGPSVTAGASVSYEEGNATATALDASLTVADPSNADLSSATVRIGTGFASGDALSFTNQNGIAGSYASGTGVLTLSGTATLAQYQTALRSIGFSTSSTTGGNRTIDWVVGDGTVTSATATSTVDVTAGPSVAAGASVGYEEGNATATALDASLTVADPSNADLSGATVRVGTGFASGDTLHFSTQHGISGGYASGTGVLTLTGSATVANYQAALESITFSTTSATTGDRTIDWTVGDGTVTSASVTSTVDVTAGPSVTAGASVSYEDGAASKVLDSALTVSDPSNVDLDSATVRIGTGFASGDALSFTNQNGIAGSYASGTGILTLSGSATLAQYQVALRTIGFSTSSTTGGNRTIDWAVGDGAVNSTSVTSTVDVTAGPSVTAGASVSYEEGNATATALDASLTVADPSNVDLSSATVRIGTGFASGDTLHFSTQNGITGSYASGTGILTLSGSATLAQYQTALRTVSFSTTSTNAGDRTIDWSIGDGAVTSATATSTVDVTPPTGITSASALPTSGILGVGKSVSITLELGRAVTVTGTPTLTLNDNGGVATYDAAASTSTALVFKYTVGTGQAAGTLAVSSLNLPNGATIRDGNGVNLSLSLPASATFTGLGIDTTPPTVHAASLTVAEDSAAKAIGIAAPSDTLSLTIAVTGLPTDGTVTLAGGVTAVTNGEALTSAQLTGLDFKPTPNLYDSSSAFAYSVTDSAGNVANGSATLAISPQANPPAGLTGDGQSDLLMTENPSGVLDLDELSGAAMSFTKIGGLGPEWQFEGTGQFLGDGKTGELLWDSISNGMVVAEDNAGAAKYTSIGAVGPEWQFEGDGAFLGQSTSDFLLWDQDNGVLVVGSVSSSDVAQYAAIGGASPAQWAFEGVGDYLGDGKTGFLMEDKTAGTLVVGEDVDGAAVYTSISAIGPTQWTFEGTGDLLGHNQDDFLIRNTSSGALVVGEYSGGTEHYTQIGNVGSEWQFLGVGNYDGKSDAEFMMRDNDNGGLFLGAVAGGTATYTPVGSLSPTQWNFHTTNVAALS